MARKLDPPQARRVKELGLPGIYFLEESKRYYPLREVGAHTLGYVGTDNHGLAGLEAMYDKVVAGKPGRRTVLRDARQGMAVPANLPSAAPVPGNDLHLTIDAALQQIAERELAKADRALSRAERQRGAARPGDRRGAGARLVADLRPQPLRGRDRRASGAIAR